MQRKENHAKKCGSSQLTVGSEACVFQDRLLRLLDDERLETGIIYQGAATRWVSIL